MPHDLGKENHPYKYRYGKLFHSGYHFIDLIADFFKINNLTSDDKRIINGTVVGEVFTPSDELAVFTKDDYKRIFKNEKLSEIYENLSLSDFENYGEKNFYGLFNFMNMNNKIITTANLELLHYGYSRRGWYDSKDYYKSNGRVRHERINIQVGPLLNIQVHSYQSKEIKDRQTILEEIGPGGLEHFDIYIYRNVDIIGGKQFERIQLKDLYNNESNLNNFIGYNEYAREEFISKFLAGNNFKGDLLDQQLAIKLLCAAAKILCYKNDSQQQTEKIKILTRNDFIEK